VARLGRCGEALLIPTRPLLATDLAVTIFVNFGKNRYPATRLKGLELSENGVAVWTREDSHAILAHGLFAQNLLCNHLASRDLMEPLSCC
jgi:hypothetical protein